MTSKLGPRLGAAKQLRVPPWQPRKDFFFKDLSSEEESVMSLAQFLRSGKTTVLTGAGVSVDSGIRAYRGPGGSYEVNPEHRPIFHQEFIASPEYRRRYWARSYVGYPPVTQAQPNAIHTSLARLQKMHIVNGLITQNVDGLHERAMDPRTLETYVKPDDVCTLHGTLRLVHCLDCHDVVQRDTYQERLTQNNPDWAELIYTEKYSQLNPDGDVSLSHLQEKDFNVVPCEKCGGPMKPIVTFFGGIVEPEEQAAAKALIDDSSRLLVVGSSLAVMSALRLVRHAYSQKKPVAILNKGETRGEDMASLRIGYEAADILPRVVEQLETL